LRIGDLAQAAVFDQVAIKIHQLIVAHVVAMNAKRSADFVEKPRGAVQRRWGDDPVNEPAGGDDSGALRECQDRARLISGDIVIRHHPDDQAIAKSPRQLEKPDMPGVEKVADDIGIDDNRRALLHCVVPSDGWHGVDG